MRLSRQFSSYGAALAPKLELVLPATPVQPRFFVVRFFAEGSFNLIRTGMDERPLGRGHGFYVEAEKGEDHCESEGKACPAYELALVRELVLGEDSAHSVGEGGLDFC